MLSPDACSTGMDAVFKRLKAIEAYMYCAAIPLIGVKESIK
ncbi:hypothetical protein BH11CYA1_BH11CYA1_35500 [soil metagenome]